MKKLPKIYHEDITKEIKNNKKVSYVEKDSNRVYEKDKINEVLKEVFNGIGYSFNIPLRIETVDKTYETSLIGKSNNYLITFDNDTILINDIKSIKKL